MTIRLVQTHTLVFDCDNFLHEVHFNPIGDGTVDVHHVVHPRAVRVESNTVYSLSLREAREHWRHLKGRGFKPHS